MVALTNKPLVTVSPRECTGYEVGSLSLIKGGRNPADARRFCDWALGVSAQRIMPEYGSFQVPSNADVSISKEAPNLSAIKLKYFLTAFGIDHGVGGWFLSGSAPPAAARPPPCASSQASSTPAPATSKSTARTLPPCPPPTATSRWCSSPTPCSRT